MSQGQTRRVLPSLNRRRMETAHIKAEPEEQNIEQKEVELPGGHQKDISTESHFPSKTERNWNTVHEHASHSDNDDDLEPFSCSTAQVEKVDGDYIELPIKDRSTAAENSGLPLKYKSASKTSATVNDADLSETDQGAKRKKNECPFCQKKFDCKMNLKRHLRVHTGERPYSCPICLKTFTYKGNLDAHSTVHTGERPHICSVCNNTFARRSGLKEHMKTHTNEKPYSCSICEKTFAHKGNLTTHMRTHTNEKPYKCTLCEKSFALKNTLDIHTRQHTGEKPYRCSICDKDFYQGSHLYKHMKSTHTNRNQS